MPKNYQPNFLKENDKNKGALIKKAGRYLIILLAVLSMLSFVAVAGSLTPSASPASTMKTLQEIYDSIAGTFDSSSITASQNGFSSRV